MELSAEQQSIIDAPLDPLSVTACAGSGKTITAVHRLVAMRRLLASERGRVALLSFSNVAVDTFRSVYQVLAQTLPHESGRSRVDIDTLDGFITSHVLRPHAHRTMGSTKASFLVMGTEPFLTGFTCPSANFPISITQVKVGIHDGELFFYYDYHGNVEVLDQNAAREVVFRLGRTGGYTHELGRYWCYRSLLDQPRVLRALARRYPHILIDEAQDIGSLHQAILELLIEMGVKVSLIGDPNQGIYEFAGADGDFLRKYDQREGVSAFELTRNYRSLPPILSLANHLSGRDDSPYRTAEYGANGAYFIGYTERELPHLMDAFHAEVINLGLSLDASAILCRGNSLVSKLAGASKPVGQGTVKAFAEAALLRDKHGRFLDAFKAVARGATNLLDNPPTDLMSKLNHPGNDLLLRKLRRRLWTFTRDTANGLPSSRLPAKSDWHPLLVTRVRSLMNDIQQDFDLNMVGNMGRKLASTKLPETPLNIEEDLAAERGPRIRVDTVHQAKGESIDAVLYVATKQHVQEMLDGVQTELGRIGYVAATRARNLLWLGVPSRELESLRPRLLEAGFQEAGRRITD